METRCNCKGVNNSATTDNWMSLQTHVYLVLFLFLFLAILIGNALVIIVYHRKSTLHTVSNYITIQLAYADVAVAMGILYHAGTLYIPDLDTNNLLCVTRYVALFFPVSVSYFVIIFLSLDRYISITRPLHHEDIMKPRVAVCVVVTCWGTGLLLMGVCPIIFKQALLLETPVRCSSMIHGVTREFIIGVLLPLMTVSLVGMLAIYAKIYSIVRKKSNEIGVTLGEIAPRINSKDVDKGEAKSRRSSKKRIRTISTASNILGRNRKTLKTLGIVFGSFAGFWTPFFLSVVIEMGMDLPAGSGPGGSLGVLGLFNAVTNPFIYAKTMTDFQAEFRKLNPCKKNNRNGSTTSLEDPGPLSVYQIIGS